MDQHAAESKVAAAEVTPIRKTMRVAAVVMLMFAFCLIAAEWVAPTLGVAPGALLAAGLVLCLSANVLSALLLIGRSRR